MSGILSSLACYNAAAVGSRVYVVFPATAGTWTVPAGVSSVTVEAVGIGGRKDAGATASLYGGGGGAYAKSIITVSAGQTIYYGATEAAAQGPTSAEAVWVNKSANSQPTTSVDGVSAMCGGRGGAKVVSTGGQSTSSIGTTTYSGGTAINTAGGGGGGAAGPNGAGGDGSATAGGSCNGGLLAGPTTAVSAGYTYVIPSWGGSYGIGTGGFVGSTLTSSLGGAAGGGASVNAQGITVMGGSGIIVITY